MKMYCIRIYRYYTFLIIKNKNRHYNANVKRVICKNKKYKNLIHRKT